MTLDDLSVNMSPHLNTRGVSKPDYVLQRRHREAWMDSQRSMNVTSVPVGTIKTAHKRYILEVCVFGIPLMVRSSQLTGLERNGPVSGHPKSPNIRVHEACTGQWVLGMFRNTRIES